MRRRFRYTLIETVADNIFAPSLFEFLQRSDSGYLFVGAASEDDAGALAEAVTAQSPADVTVQTQANPDVAFYDQPRSSGAEYLVFFLIG